MHCVCPCTKNLLSIHLIFLGIFSKDCGASHTAICMAKGDFLIHGQWVSHLVLYFIILGTYKNSKDGPNHKGGVDVHNRK